MSKPDVKPFRVQPGDKVHLKDIPSEIKNSGYNKASAYNKISENVVVMAQHAKKLYAENRRSILLVLQGMDRWRKRRHDPIGHAWHESA